MRSCGEIEEWRILQNCGGLYKISNTGKVWSVKRKREMAQNKDRRGYPRISLEIDKKTKTFRVHRLVAEAFIPNPKGLREVNHIDGNKENNNVSNLEWVTSKENVRHAFENGLHSHTRAVRVIETGEVFNTIAKFKGTYGCKSGSALQNALKNGRMVKGVHIEYVR